MMRTIVMGLVIPFLTVPFHVYAESAENPDYSPLIEKYTRLFEEEMQKQNITGMSVALTDGRQTLWSRGFGYENLADKKAATSRTVYGIGSMTKVFTAAAVMQLHGQKALDIDQPMARYLPLFRIRSQFDKQTPITPRQVLTHHAGIPADLMTSPDDQDFRAYPALTAGLETIFPIDYIDCYSNLGFCLLGNLVESVSHTPYEKYLENNLFRPLDMTQTRILGMRDTMDGVSRVYDHTGAEKTENPTPSIPAGGVYSHVDDMAGFLRMWLSSGSGPSKPVLDAGCVDEMLRVQNRAVALDMGKSRGLCWDMEPGDAGWLYSHGGALIYFRSQMTVAPDAGLAAVILVNSSNGGGITWRCKELVKEAARIKGVKPSGPRATMAAPARPALTPLAPQSIPGVYVTDFMHLRLDADGANFITKMGDTRLRLVPGEGNRYSMQYSNGDTWQGIPDEVFYFTRIQGLTLFLQEKWGSLNVAGVQIKPAALSDRWMGRCGKYRVAVPQKHDWFSETELAVQDGIPVLITPLTVVGQTAPFHLTIEGDSRARVSGIGRYSGNVAEFVPNPGDGQTLRFMGLELRKVTDPAAK